MDLHLRRGQMMQRVAYSISDLTKNLRCTLMTTSSAVSRQLHSRNQGGCFLLVMMTSTAMFGILWRQSEQVYFYKRDLNYNFCMYTFKIGGSSIVFPISFWKYSWDWEPMVKLQFVQLLEKLPSNKCRNWLCAKNPVNGIKFSAAIIAGTAMWVWPIKLTINSFIDMYIKQDTDNYSVVPQ